MKYFKALDIARERKLLLVNKKGVTKEQIKKQEEIVIKEVIEELMDQNGGYTRPELNQILWIQIIRLPRTIYELLIFNIDWVWRFYIQRQEYSELEQESCHKSMLKIVSYIILSYFNRTNFFSGRDIHNGRTKFNYILLAFPKCSMHFQIILVTILEQEYIIRKRLGMTERQWSSLDDRNKNIYMVRKLWEKEAWQQWQEVSI